MTTPFKTSLIVFISIAAAQLGIAVDAVAADAGKLRVISEQTVSGFVFPESVAYDPKEKVLYMSQFGGTELKPAEKDGNGKISKVSLTGKIIEERFLPAAGETMNKPKGIFMSPKDPRGIYSLSKSGELKELAKAIGRLDGLYQMQDGSILATDWNSGSLFRWTEKSGMETLVSGFKGPADFAVAPDGKGVTVFVPDLPGSQLRIVRLGK